MKILVRLLLVLACAFLVQDLSSRGVVYFAQAQAQDPLICPEEHAALEECISVVEEGLGNDEHFLPSDQIQTDCSAETNSLSECLLNYQENPKENGVSSGLCYLSFTTWAVCTVQYPARCYTPCFSVTIPDVTCEQYQTHHCRRWNCCEPCRDIYYSYRTCMERSTGIGGGSGCDPPSKTESECEDEATNWWKIFGIIMACILGIGLCVLLVFVLVRSKDGGPQAGTNAISG